MTDASRGVPRAAPQRDDAHGDVVTDVTLLERIGDRSADALAQLYDRFGRPAYSLARRICIDEALAEDVVQEVFLVVWRDPGRFDPARGSVSTWLLTLVHHRAVDAVRREATRRRRTVAPSEDGEEWNVPPGPGADQAALGAVVAGKVRDALASLPAEQREALALAYFGGYTQREVASLVGVPLGTVKSRMFTGTKKLRSLLGPHVEVEEEGR
ncbi:RNA polymerase sigma-70 factor (ECF subfamily) [Actinomycetospora cinnamomea]|uniref:RNA polymerase sigma-70 factor (ECF subfamily) n=1 Tax=Actinomycetospora cinnamomea TaxID=663609 RepID=A0A2U1FPM2_9PSEU|nr:RNA polymerase sigma-70 factor (ECF subfamily) [Actinomycetospora cinnamomea]